MINYSQSWEDPRILLEALALTADDVVLSITSGGDNTLALLAEGPARVVALDRNAEQSKLLRRKYELVRTLTNRDFIAAVSREFLGAGRFERFLSFFRRWIVPFVSSQASLSELLSSTTLANQQNWFAANGARWHVLFKVGASRTVLRAFARQKGMFKEAQAAGVAETYFKRFKRGITEVPVGDNFFLHYFFTGRYGSTLPPYLTETVGERLRALPGERLEIESEDILAYLRRTSEATFSAYNLSDVCEALTAEENDALWSEIVRTARPGARVALWNNLVERGAPSHLQGRAREERERGAELAQRDRVFFYDRFRLYTITP